MLRSPSLALRLLAILALTPLALAGCDDTAGPAPGGPDTGADASPFPICEVTGEPTAPERCDGRDNDCDGRPDEGFDLQNDRENCGACDVVCAYDNATAACANGECLLARCDEGWADADGRLDNGCEWRCATIQPEQCNDIDDDCDGRIDETFDRNESIANCGTCGTVCRFDNAIPFCDDGQCRIRQCEPGWGDIDRDPDNGCEAPCNPQTPGIERCDDEDNDCDGMVDEDFNPQNDPENCGACDVVCAFANATARCFEGGCEIVACDPGFADADGDRGNGCEIVCRPTEPPFEVCDGIDNDCNGEVDDGYDFQTDPQNCGGCGDGEVNTCRLPNTVPTCESGECTATRCVEGFTDADGEPENGCETVCVVQNNGSELCNGEDDDCDGRTDEDYDLQTDADHCGRCGNACDYDNATGRCERGRCVLAPEACDPGWVDADQDPLTGCEYRCTPAPGGAEACNGEDDDCDTFTDEGYDVFTDLDHCGGCDRPCRTPNAIAVCNAGQCEIGGCDPGWSDANGEVEDGCELDCQPTNNGIEECDGIDNDCDALVDEGYDFTSDVAHCGRCGFACTYPNGRLSCVDRTCRVEGCLEGWFDANGDDADGCEYRCQRSNGGVETCDRRDNDCDGRVDETYDLSTDVENCGACDNACVFANAVPTCVDGRCRIAACEPGWVNGDSDPTTGCNTPCAGDPEGGELCNEVDDDCDQIVDEGFDLDNDIDNCGACGAPCDLPRASPFCNGGECLILSCDPGFVDLDDRPETGCECRLSNGGIEICDGFDNDCNGIVDDPGRVVPPPDTRCLTFGVCRGVQPTCQDAAWRCEYGPTYEADERSCDAIDNDCDGRADEAFEELGRPCSAGLGICRDEGTLACDGFDGIACTAVARDERAVDEACNGLDDDCDGIVDEDSDLLVTIPGGGGVPAFSIYAYEASRTDADADTAGQSFARACSKPDALPWVEVDYNTALAACAAAGMRLCSAAEWGRACAGPQNQSYPYGNAYQPDRCNGLDYDTDPLTPENEDETLPTGTLDTCARNLGGGPVFDLSGNVWEWTSEDLSGDGTARAVRGGSAGNLDGGLTCQFSNATPPGAFRANIGFRCCGPPR